VGGGGGGRRGVSRGRFGGWGGGAGLPKFPLFRERGSVSVVLPNYKAGWLFQEITATMLWELRSQGEGRDTATARSYATEDQGRRRARVYWQRKKGEREMKGNEA